MVWLVIQNHNFLAIFNFNDCHIPIKFFAFGPLAFLFELFLRDINLIGQISILIIKPFIFKLNII